MPNRITKFIGSLNKKTRNELKQKLLDLEKNPFKIKGVKKLRGGSGNLYRLKMGKIRIIYRVSHADIEVIDIDYRGNIYP